MGGVGDSSPLVPLTAVSDGLKSLVQLVAPSLPSHVSSTFLPLAIVAVVGLPVVATESILEIQRSAVGPVSCGVVAGSTVIEQ